MEFLNGFWALGSLAGVGWALWRYLGTRHSGIKALGRLQVHRHAGDLQRRFARDLLAVLLLSGFLFPAISASDDAAMLDLQVAQVNTQLAQSQSGAQSYVWSGRENTDSSASYILHRSSSGASIWLLFEHLGAPPSVALQIDSVRYLTGSSLATGYIPAPALSLHSRAPPRTV